MQSWSKYENFNNLDYTCPNFGFSEGGWTYLQTFEHSIDRGYTLFARAEKNKGSVPVYQVNDVSRYNKKILNAYLKGAALCAQRDMTFESLQLNRC